MSHSEFVPKAKRMYIPKLMSVLALAILGAGIYLLGRTIIAIFHFEQVTGLSPKTLAALIVDGGQILHSSSGRTNILIMGIGGESHEAGQLTDTILVLSLDVPRRAYALISVPRDIWSEDLKDKINSAYYYGEQKKTGGGLLLAKVTLEEVVGIPIHYTVVLDFSAFTNIIDLIGGIDVSISKGFTDKNYPVGGKEDDLCDGDPLFQCRFKVVTFMEGKEHMDGDRALIYVRSRQAEGDEGTDFSRGKRQQEVLDALKKAIMKPSTWFSFTRVGRLLEATKSSFHTDMNVSEMLSAAKNTFLVGDENSRNISLEAHYAVGQASLYGGRYVLVPREGKEQVYTYIRDVLSLQRN